MISKLRLVAVSLLTFTAIAASAAFQVPPMTAPVMDEAGLLDRSTISILDQGIRNLRARGGPQITVLIVPSLEGTPIEQATIMVTDRWRMGSAKADDGVLFMIAAKDRTMRIEVGVGLQGELTDADSKRIIADEVAPLFREGRYDDGVASGVFGIVRRTNPDIDPASLFGGQRSRPRSVEVDVGSSKLIRYFLILLFILFFLRPRRRRRGFASGLMWGGMAGWGAGRGWGGGGGFGGGGGGWSGGGGGFNGGGASGNW